MTLGDLLKRVTEDDKDKMFILRDGHGWSNVDFIIKDSEITVVDETYTGLFTSDKE